MVQSIFTPAAPAPSGHYSQAVAHNGIVYVSGQLPFDPLTGKICPGGIEEQAERVLKNLAEILTAAGSDLQHVLKVTIYIPGVKYWPPVNLVYARVFGEHKPARCVVPVAELNYGALIELEAVAAQIDTGEV